MVTIANARSVANKSHSIGLANARPPCLREPHHINPQLIEAIVYPLRGSRHSRSPHTEAFEGLHQESFNWQAPQSSLTNTPKPEIWLGDSPVPLRAQESRRFSPASVTRVGRPLWCHGARGICTVGLPSKPISGPCLEVRPQPLKLVAVVECFFTGRDCKTLPIQLGQP